MQHVIPQPIFFDSNANQRTYSHLQADELLVSCIFTTLQGEGPFTGQRCLFIRLSGCNMGGKSISGIGCSWCDADFRVSEGEVYSFEQLWRQIDAQHPGPTSSTGQRLVVITGGEPMLQRNLSTFLHETLLNPAYADYTFQIESNGSKLIPLPKAVYLVVSPKIPERAVRLSDGRFAVDSTATYMNIPKAVLARADCLKVLVSATRTSPYHTIPDFAFEYQEQTKRPVYLSPINVYKRGIVAGSASIWDETVYDTNACRENHHYAALLCQQTGFELSLQTHLFCALP